MLARRVSSGISTFWVSRGRLQLSGHKHSSLKKLTCDSGNHHTRRTYQLLGHELRVSRRPIHDVFALTKAIELGSTGRDRQYHYVEYRDRSHSSLQWPVQHISRPTLIRSIVCRSQPCLRPSAHRNRGRHSGCYNIACRFAVRTTTTGPCGAGLHGSSSTCPSSSVQCAIQHQTLAHDERATRTSSPREHDWIGGARPTEIELQYMGRSCPRKSRTIKQGAETDYRD